VQALTDTFEAHAQQTEGGIEFWLARDFQYLLGYTKRDNFLKVLTGELSTPVLQVQSDESMGEPVSKLRQIFDATHDYRQGVYFFNQFDAIGLPFHRRSYA
jgi:AAA+ superfamily predicted ATPase